MNRFPSNLVIHSGVNSDKISAVNRPGIFFKTKTKSPLEVGRISKSSKVTPCFLINPSAAEVGFPSLKAVEAGGPLISSSRSGWWLGSPSINTANRRGVPQT